MTKDRLMEIYYIQKEINSWTAELEKIRAYEKNAGMSMAWGRKKTPVRKAEDEEKIQRKIELKLEELRRARNEVIGYILNIDDAQTRLIFKLRCLNLMSWNAVADEVGGMNSEDSVKKRFYRYLESCG